MTAVSTSLPKLRVWKSSWPFILPVCPLAPYQINHQVLLALPSQYLSYLNSSRVKGVVYRCLWHFGLFLQQHTNRATILFSHLLPLWVTTQFMSLDGCLFGFTLAIGLALWSPPSIIIISEKLIVAAFIQSIRICCKVQPEFEDQTLLQNWLGWTHYSIPILSQHRRTAAYHSSTPLTWCWTHRSSPTAVRRVLCWSSRFAEEGRYSSPFPTAPPPYWSTAGKGGYCLLVGGSPDP